MRNIKFTFLMLLALPVVIHAQYTGSTGSGDLSIALNGKHLTNWFFVAGNWSTTGSWRDGALPASSENAIIKAAAVVDDAYSYPDLTIETTGSVTISPGKSLTITGTLTNSASTGGLIIQSTGSGTGSLITNGTISGAGVATAQVQRYMAADAWHLISSPISDALSGIFVNEYLKPFVESTNDWGTYITSLTTALTAGKGFACWPVTSQAYTFTGTLNTGTVSPSLIWTDAFHGNNLVGNPYPSAIDWNGSGWTKTNIGGTIWIWNQNSTDPGPNNYGTWNGTIGTNSVTRYIPVGQGFFVQATGAPALSMTNGVRVHNTQDFLKKSDLPNALRLHAQNFYGSDEIVVYFDPASSWIYDPQIDSRKMFGEAVAPQLFSFKPGEPEELSINVLPEIKNPLVVPVSLKVGSNGQYSITASQMESFPANVSLYLEDLKLSKAQDLRVNPGYSFAADTNDIAHRFNLHFSNFPYGIPGPASDNAFRIYSFGQTIYVKSGTGLNNYARIFVYDALGRTLHQSAFSVISLNKFDLNLSHGNYIVKVLANSGVYTQKVFID
jgi:hypothetical protein